MATRRVIGAVAATLMTLASAGCGPGTTPVTPTVVSGSPVASNAAPTQAPTSIGTLVSDPPNVGVPGGDVPPDASLAAEGGDPVLGQLGSYAWLGTGSDAPWLPGAPITVGAGEPISVRFEPDGAIVGWRARFVPAGRTDPQGAQSLGEGPGAPAFPAPPAGSWTAEVTVDFGPDVGSASYFWRLDVR